MAGVSQSGKLLSYMQTVEEQTPDPVERWAMLKGMIVAVDNEKKYSREYQREYQKKHRVYRKVAEREK